MSHVMCHICFWSSSHRVCVCVCLCVWCPLPMQFFSRPLIGPQLTWSDPGLSLALRSHDHIPGSYWGLQSMGVAYVFCLNRLILFWCPVFFGVLTCRPRLSLLWFFLWGCGCIPLRCVLGRQLSWCIWVSEQFSLTLCCFWGDTLLQRTIIFLTYFLLFSNF